VSELNRSCTDVVDEADTQNAYTEKWSWNLMHRGPECYHCYTVGYLDCWRRTVVYYHLLSSNLCDSVSKSCFRRQFVIMLSVTEMKWNQHCFTSGWHHFVVFHSNLIRLSRVLLDYLPSKLVEFRNKIWSQFREITHFRSGLFFAAPSSFARDSAVVFFGKLYCR